MNRNVLPQGPHARAWLYMSLLFAQSPVGTHPHRNQSLLTMMGGPQGLHETMLAVAGVCLTCGWTGGVA